MWTGSVSSSSCWGSSCLPSSTSRRRGRTPSTREGTHFVLTAQGKASLGLFLIAGVWWVFEVVPIGVTSIAIAVVQALFLIRPDRFFRDEAQAVSGVELALKEFWNPSVWFIFGSLVIGMVFTKTGLTKRLAYKMLAIVGERTSSIYLGCFVLTACSRT